MKAIQLTKGKFAIVDNDDFGLISKYNWHFNSNNGAAARKICKGGKEYNQFMHRLIVNAQKGYEVDHINGNRLDNRKSNLRICTHQQNMCNQKPRKGFKGVSFKKDRNKWKSYIKVNYRQIHLGYFDDPVDAAVKYNEAAKTYFGEFARLNYV